MTRGRFGKGLFRILGVSELPILLNTDRLSYLIMVDAHNEDHRESKSTLARSRTQAWIVKGMQLARKVVAECQGCKLKRRILLSQKMGDLPEERWSIGNPPWTAVSVDLMGPSLVRGMVNKRTVMKVWPLIISCLSTGAVHVGLMDTHGTEAFLMQWENFTALRGSPKVVWSDRGSQLTSASNYVT